MTNRPAVISCFGARLAFLLYYILIQSNTLQCSGERSILKYNALVDPGEKHGIKIVYNPQIYGLYLEIKGGIGSGVYLFGICDYA